jgi:hypothetical protein
MALDLSAFAYFAPIFSFLLVFVVSYAILLKFKLLGDDLPKAVVTFVAFVIATLFISVGSVQTYVTTIVPWFAVFLISLFFLLTVMSFASVSDGMKKGVGVIFVVGLLVAFLVSGIVVFSDSLGPYLPFNSHYTGNYFTDWLYSSRVLGTLFLLAVAGVVSWFLAKTKK